MAKTTSRRMRPLQPNHHHLHRQRVDPRCRRPRLLPPVAFPPPPLDGPPTTDGDVTTPPPTAGDTTTSFSPPATTAIAAQWTRAATRRSYRARTQQAPRPVGACHGGMRLPVVEGTVRGGAARGKGLGGAAGVTYRGPVCCGSGGGGGGGGRRNPVLAGQLCAGAATQRWGRRRGCRRRRRQ